MLMTAPSTRQMASLNANRFMILESPSPRIRCKLRSHQLDMHMTDSGCASCEAIDETGAAPTIIPMPAQRKKQCSQEIQSRLDDTVCNVLYLSPSAGTRR